MSANAQENQMPMSAAALSENDDRVVSASQPPVIDLVHLSRQTLGDGALENELLRLFIVQAQQYASCLGKELLQEDGQKQADLAHRLKGSARAVGAFPLAEAAASYEAALRAGAINPVCEARRLAEAIERARIAAGQLL